MSTPPRRSRARQDGGGKGTASPAIRALADAAPVPLWLDRPTGPAPGGRLAGTTHADLAVAGAGFAGLWTALLAKEADPSLDVVVLEADLPGTAASGRNGGFVSSSLTHGVTNGEARLPGEIARLEQLGQENFEELGATIERYGIDCHFERNGELQVATERYQLDALVETHAALRRYGGVADLLDGAATRAAVASPTYLGGLWVRSGAGLVDPAALSGGLVEACLRHGVRFYTRSPVRAIERSGTGLVLRSPYGQVHAGKAALAVNAFRSPLRRTRAYVVPVWDYVLATEPLTPGQLESLAWRDRQGVSDSGNQFHYYRLTPDNRILFGGYDAVYYPGGGTQGELADRPETFLLLAEHFFATFPQLEGVSFSHAWGGVIDTCSRFFAFYGSAYAGRLAYAAGYTGLGVGATRFAAKVVLELLAGRGELLDLDLVRTRPVPFPPEPLRRLVVDLTRRSLARADAHQGRRDPWLRLLDRLGIGFDS